MTHNREYIFNQEYINSVKDFVDRLSDIPRYEGVRLLTVKDRDGKIDYFEIDASNNTGEKCIVRDANDCLRMVCSDAYILGMMFDYKYVVFKP